MKDTKRVFALGFFDGVHLGHQALLKECRDLAAQLDCETAAITFESHPQSLYCCRVPPLISTAAERRRLLRQYGIRHIRSYPVTRAVMEMPWQDFLEELTASGAAGFVCGDDFHFGYRGEGNSEKLQSFCREHQIPCIIVPEQSIGGIRVSSTYIRTQLETGDMATAVRFLGHPYALTGTVVHGHKIGRKLGMPTANLLLPEDLVIPKFGVYVCRALIDCSVFPAVTNIGTRPTVSGSGITVEPWILDFEGDLYDREITLEFYRFLRPEMKFPDLEALRAQIQADAASTRAYFEEQP
jgi:riboflavin kinase/FMN adenylyltransferase